MYFNKIHAKWNWNYYLDEMILETHTHIVMRYISKEFEIVFVHLCIPNVYFHQLKYTTILNVLGYVFVKRHGMCFLLYVSHILLILVYVHLNACIQTCILKHTFEPSSSSPSVLSTFQVKIHRLNLSRR